MTHSRARAALAAFTVAGTAGALLAQQPTFRVAVEHVSLDVVVTDFRDQPIRDLTKDDFHVVEDHRPQDIAECQFISVPPAARDINLKTAPPPIIDVGTNSYPPTSRALAFVVDDSNLRLATLAPVKQVMTDFLKTLSPDDEVAITYVRRSDLGQDFTNDIGRLIGSVDKMKGAFGPGPRPDLLFTMRNVITALSAAPQQRHALVFVSGGVASDPPSVEWMDVLSLAKRFDVPIYTIDPRGSVPTVGARQWFMQDVASQTGGLAFVNQHDLAKAVTSIMTDDGSYYLLGYSPTPLARDGKFHDVVVTVNRPGAHVRARSGYTAPADAPAPADSKATLDTAMAAGLDGAGLPLRAFVAPLTANRKGMKAVVTIEVTYPQVLDRTRPIDDTLQLSVLALDADAKIKASAKRSLPLSIADPPAGASTLLINQTIDLPSQALTVRVGISSDALNKAGTSHLAITVPDPGDDKLQLSGIVLGASSTWPTVLMQADPITRLVPFQPTTTRTFAASDTLKVFARLFWGSNAPEANVSMSITRGGTAVLSRTEAVAAAIGETGRKEATFNTTVPLHDLAAGEYVLEVIATLGKRSPAQRQLAFSIK